MSIYRTEQEAFWRGEFGDHYVDRNQVAQAVAANLHLFSKVFSKTTRIKSLIEFGANIGLNPEAIKLLLPNVELSAIEINEKAAGFLRQQEGVAVHEQSILDFEPARHWEMAFIKGVLIHISPDQLPTVYDRLYKAAARYVCLVEYYNPTPVEVTYRGHSNRLFKRDFAGEMLDRFPDLKIVDYGFMWRRDPVFPQDDCSWFLLEKSRSLSA